MNRNPLTDSADHKAQVVSAGHDLAVHRNLFVMANLCHHYWRNVGCRRIVPVWRSFRIEFALKRCLRLPERVLRPGNGERNPVRLRAPTRPQKRPHEVGGMPIVRFAAAGQPRLCVCQFVRQHSTQLGTAQLPLRNPYLMDSTGVVASNIGAEISAFAVPV